MEKGILKLKRVSLNNLVLKVILKIPEVTTKKGRLKQGHTKQSQQFW
jgi:hypothetical protein